MPFGENSNILTVGFGIFDKTTQFSLLKKFY